MNRAPGLRALAALLALAGCGPGTAVDAEEVGRQLEQLEGELAAVTRNR